MFTHIEVHLTCGLIYWKQIPFLCFLHVEIKLLTYERYLKQNHVVCLFLLFDFQGVGYMHGEHNRFSLLFLVLQIWFWWCCETTPSKSICEILFWVKKEITFYLYTHADLHHWIGLCFCLFSCSVSHQNLISYLYMLFVKDMFKPMIWF